MERLENQPPRAQPLQRIRTAEDLKRIRFTDGLAAVEVPYPLLRHIRFRNDRREESPRLDAVAESIRRRGYVPFDPIICAVTRKGRWSVVDGGHRLTAARRVAGEFWTNLFGRKVRSLYFLLMTTPRSLTGGKRKGPPADVPASVPPARVSQDAFADPEGEGAGEDETRL